MIDITIIHSITDAAKCMLASPARDDRGRQKEPTMSTEITFEELTSKIRAHAPFVLVEALPAQYYGAGHLPGAINLPLDGIEPRSSDVLPDKNAEIVVYCSGPTCQNSHVAQRKLTSMGYRNVKVFSGGKAAWSQAGGTLVTDAPRPLAANG